jgi:hypothetical protein
MDSEKKIYRKGAKDAEKRKEERGTQIAQIYTDFRRLISV